MRRVSKIFLLLYCVAIVFHSNNLAGVYLFRLRPGVVIVNSHCYGASNVGFEQQNAGWDAISILVQHWMFYV